MTSIVPEPVELFRDVLEEQFHRHTRRLGELIGYAERPDRGGYDADTLAGLLASARQDVADTAAALRRMAEGTYGVCRRCARTIPMERLEARPHAAFCVACQQATAGGGFRQPTRSQPRRGAREPSAVSRLR